MRFPIRRCLLTSPCKSSQFLLYSAIKRKLTYLFSPAKQETAGMLVVSCPDMASVHFKNHTLLDAHILFARQRVKQLCMSIFEVLSMVLLKDMAFF